MSTSLQMRCRHIVRPCPVCGRPLRIEVHLFGQDVTCGHCRGRFTASASDDLSGGLAARVDRLLERRTRPAPRTVRSGIFSGVWTAGEYRKLGRVPRTRVRPYFATEIAGAAVHAFPGKVKGVLLVEHRDKVYARLASDLASLQLQVTRASNASAASRRFAACPSNLVIAFVDLPDESGWLLAAKLRLVYPKALIWLYTAFPSARDREGARYLGVACLIEYRGDLLRLGANVINRLTRHA